MSQQLSVREFVSELQAMEGDDVYVSVGCGAPEATALLVGRLGEVEEERPLGEVQGDPPSSDGLWWIPVGDPASSTCYPDVQSGFNLYESDVLAVTRPHPTTLYVQHMTGTLEITRNAHQEPK